MADEVQEGIRLVWSTRSVRQSYTQRRLLRWVEKGWTRGEGLVNRLTSTAFNSLYHLGTLSVFLLIVLTVTGLYLTVLYRPGADRAYATVAGMSGTWLGSLMRTTHRYAADGLVLVIFLHALKMLLSDRFWGSRWLAWVSGWGLLVLIWIIGVMGYWLVWDQQAQWLTDYAISLLRGPSAVAFLSPQIASPTFGLFVIVLFLHLFLSVLIVLGVWIHELRLSRARYWAPRWLMVVAGVVLALLASWRPVSIGAPADMSRLVGTVMLDWWYLGFLPLAGSWGSPVFWAMSIVLLGTVLAFPWLIRGRHLGPAVVTDVSCTGCALCFQQCPYGAIEMRPRADDSGHKSLAVVNAPLCTGCGLCVGTCSTAGIELAGLSTAQVWEGLQQSLAEARTSGLAPVVIFTCQRHSTLGSLPEFAMTAGQRSLATVQGRPFGSDLRPRSRQAAGRQPSVAGSQAGIPAPVTLGLWGAGNPHPRASIVACSLPCVGMIQPSWVKGSLAGGAQAVLILSCPMNDCAFREGPRWLEQRLGRRQSLLEQGVYWLEVAPGDRGAVKAALGRVSGDRPPLGQLARPLPMANDGKRADWRSAVSNRRSPALSPVSGVALLALVFGLSLVAERPVTARSAAQGEMRVVLVHAGQFKSASADLPPEVLRKLPENVSPEQVLGGERYPVRLRIELDDGPVAERMYRPGGLRREGQVYGLESWPLSPGDHQVRLWLMDDETTWREVFSGRVSVEAGRARTLRYDRGQEAFALY